MATSSGFKKDPVFWATTGFIVIFAIILAIGYAMQLRVAQSGDYRLTTNTIEQWLTAGNTADAKSALTTLQNGGNVNIAGKPLTLPAINKFLSPDTFDTTSIANSLNNGVNDDAISKAKQLNEVVNAKYQKRKSLASTMMIVGAVVTLLLYFAVMIPIFTRRKGEEETQVVTKTETEGIMNTVSEGLFLLGSDHQIGVEQSASLKRMFKLERDLEGDFFDFISDYVTQENVRVAKDYLELLFGDRVKEKLVEDLNPLNNVEISLVRRDGQYENRYLDFRFKRVMVDGKISHLLGSVSDVTRQVELEQQLAQTKEEQEAQVDLLMSILHIDNSRLQTFISTSSETLDQINERLSERGHSDGQIRSKLVDIMASAHRIKGDAAALGLHKFEFGAHDFEEELEKIRLSESSLGGKDLLPAITKLRTLYTEMDSMTGLISKFSDAMGGKGDSSSQLASHLNASKAIANTALPLANDAEEADMASELNTELDGESSTEPSTESSNELSTDVSDIEDLDELDTAIENDLESLEEDSSIEDEAINVEADAADEMVDDSGSQNNGIEDSVRTLSATVSERNSTPLELNLNGLDADSVPDGLTEVVNDALIQLVRNSIVHAYEGADARESMGKKKELGISVNFEQTDDGYHLVYRDNGSGLDPKLIADKAVKNELLSAEAADKMDKSKIIKLLFHPGFSTLDEATLDGGRGVGLDVVLKRVKEHDGTISISSGVGRFSQFTIRFPRNT